MITNIVSNVSNLSDTFIYARKEMYTNTCMRYVNDLNCTRYGAIFHLYREFAK